MRLLAILAVAGFAVLLAGGPLSGTQAAAGDDAFLGAWNINVPNPNGTTRACWLELKREGDVVKGRFLAGGGSPFPVPTVAIEDGELRWEYQVKRPGQEAQVVYRARLKDGRLEGTAQIGQSPARQFTGFRPPVWKAAFAEKKAGQPVALFNGKDVSGWVGQHPDRPLGWVVNDGALDNQGKANNIVSTQKFSDFKLQVEFQVAEHSNSGVYIRGRHEIQVVDDFGKEPDQHSAGAIYGFVPPAVNPSKKAGEWQTLEATVVGNRLTVVMNGKKIHDNAVIPAITGGALDANEGEPGPIMLQGDHGPVLYRKVVVTPLL